MADIYKNWDKNLNEILKKGLEPDNEMVSKAEEFTAIINDNDMEITVRGDQEEVIRELLKDKMFCLLKMPAEKPKKCVSKFSSSVFVDFMEGMGRTFAIRDVGLSAKYEECEYYLSVYYRRETDNENRGFFERNLKKIIAQSISSWFPTEDEVVFLLKGKELVLITNYMQYGNMEAFKVDDLLNNILFLRKDSGSDFIRRDEKCDIRVYLSRINSDGRDTEHRLCPMDIRELDVGRRVVNILEKKSKGFFGEDGYYSMEFASQTKDIQAMYFATRFHSNKQWEADPVNIVIARIAAFVLPGSVSVAEPDMQLPKKKKVKALNGEEYIIDAIHFNSDIFYDLTAFGEYLDSYFAYFAYD